jgi:hypothetical protein
MDSASDRRRTGRVRLEPSLTCNLGRVLDLSAGGLSVMTRRALEGVVVLELSDEQGGLRCEAKIVRCRRLGFFRHEVGVQLPPLDDQARATLNRFCMTHRDENAVRVRDAA